MQVSQVQSYFDEVKTDLQDKYALANELGQKAQKLQEEVDSILEDLKEIENRRAAEEEAKIQDALQN